MRRLALLLLLLLGCHANAPTPRVIFVGLDGADWQLLDRFMADGTMPTLARLVREGDRRVLRTQHPPLSPLVWTTMMTGVSPLEHRILDFTRFNPVTRQREPITSDERAVPAIWNMASSAGKTVDVFGLWATYPAEEVNGTMVSDRLFTFQFDAPPAPGCVWPPAQESWARGVLADVMQSVPRVPRRSSVPRSAPVPPGTGSARGTEEPRHSEEPRTEPRNLEGPRLHGRIVIETELLHRLATERIAKDRPDLAIVYFQGTDAIGHLFAPHADDPAVRGYFARIDTILDDYAKLASGEHAQLIIASDHGFDWFGNHGSATDTALAAKWHRDEGIYVEWPKKESGGELRVDQICSTLLKRLGMPVDLDHYRRAFRRSRSVRSAPANEKIAELQALGYIGSGEPSQAPAGSTSTRTAASFDNEGLILRDLGREDDAIHAFESGLKIDPNSASVKWNLGNTLFARGRRALEAKDCRAALEDFTGAASYLTTSAIVQTSIGTASLCAGDEATARKAFAKSLELDPNQPELREMVARFRGSAIAR